MDQFVRLRVIDICTVFGGNSVEPDGVVNGRGNVDYTRRRRALVSREQECAAMRRIAVNLNSNDTVDSIRYVDLVSFEVTKYEMRFTASKLSVCREAAMTSGSWCAFRRMTADRWQALKA